MTIRSGNEYATVIVVAMDDQPLRNVGKDAGADGHVGSADRLENETGRVQGRRQEDVQGLRDRGDRSAALADGEYRRDADRQQRKSKTATLLDTAGYPVKKLNGVLKEGKFIVTLPLDALYVVLE